MLLYDSFIGRRHSAERVIRSLRAWLFSDFDKSLWETFCKEVVPLVSCVYRGMSSDYDSNDVEDVCSLCLFRMWVYFRKKDKKVLLGLSDGSLWNVIISVIRSVISNFFRDYKRKDNSYPCVFKRRQPSVFSIVSLRAMEEELPRCVYKRALMYNRWGYDDLALKTAVQFYFDGVSDWELLRSWFSVDDVSHLYSFVSLMAKWVMSEYFSGGVFLEEYEVEECLG